MKLYPFSFIFTLHLFFILGDTRIFYFNFTLTEISLLLELLEREQLYKQYDHIF